MNLHHECRETLPSHLNVHRSHQLRHCWIHFLMPVLLAVGQWHGTVRYLHWLTLDVFHRFFCSKPGSWGQHLMNTGIRNKNCQENVEGSYSKQQSRDVYPNKWLARWSNEITKPTGASFLTKCAGFFFFSLPNITWLVLICSLFLYKPTHNLEMPNRHLLVLIRFLAHRGHL